MIHSLIVFGFALVLWILVRSFTWPLPVLFMRIFWAGVIVLAAGSAMFQSVLGKPVSEVVQEMAGGLAAAEAVVLRVRLRWLRFKQRHPTQPPRAE